MFRMHVHPVALFGLLAPRRIHLGTPKALFDDFIRFNPSKRGSMGFRDRRGEGNLKPKPGALDPETAKPRPHSVGGLLASFLLHAIFQLILH